MPDNPDAATAVTGAPFGAFRFATLDRLFGGQRVALVAIIRSIHSIATASYERRRGKPKGTLSDRDLLSLDHEAYFDRPHHTFVIDGVRGSGKTTVLLTLYGYIKALRFDTEFVPAPVEPDDTVRRDLAALALPPVAGATGQERTALILPIVFPETMESHESAMEAILAHMDQVLFRFLDDDTIGDDRRRRLEELQGWLRQRIGAAWMYSRKIGEQTLANDALTYDEFVVRRAEQNRRSYTRIDTWRYFVDRYLDELGYEVLVLSFDDSDLVPEAADDIMRTIRVYLSHSRIVSLMAVELQTLQETLSLFKLTSRSPGMLEGQAVRISKLAAMEERNVSAQLDKILPTDLRFRLGTAHDQLDSIFTGGFTAFCKQQFRHPSMPDRDRNAMSWWLLAGGYSVLVSDTVRRIVSVHAAAKRPGHDIDRILLEYSKFQDLRNVTNHRLAGVRDAIMRGKLRRAETPMSETNEYDPFFEPHLQELSLIESLLVEFVLDRDLALGGLDVSVVPELGRWLGVDPGAEMDDDEARPAKALPYEDAARIIGVASLLSKLPLPGNCLYLSDLAVLDEVDRTPPGRTASWVARLAGQVPSAPGGQDLGSAITTLADSDDGTALKWLLVQFEALRRGPSRFSGLPGLKQVISNPAVAPEVLFSVLRAVAGGRARSRGDLIEALMYDTGPGQVSTDEADAFDMNLLDFLEVVEGTRRLAMRTWVNAVKVGRKGRDKAHPSRDGAREERGVGTSIPGLLEETTAILADGTDPRAAALLGWCLQSSILSTLDFGFGQSGPRADREHWERLVQGLRTASDILRPIGPRGKGATQAARFDQRWLFPDFEAADRKTMSEALDALANTVAERLRTEGPPGLRDNPPDQWPTEPEALLASLLGVTLRSLREHHVVHP